LFSETNRLNAGWARGKYVIASFDGSTHDLNEYLQQWVSKTMSYTDQTLCLEINRNEWKFYDHAGNEISYGIAFPTSTSYVFESLQQIFYGAPGTGKSHSVNQIVEEDAIKRAIRFAQYLQTVTKPNGEPLADRTMKGYLATPKIDWVIDIARKCPTISDSIETVYDIEDAEAIEEIRKTVAKTSKDIDGNNMYSSALGHYSKMLEVNTVFRTTFHPDTDYASFVGCYKPQMGSTGNIEYSFCPQVFTEAYITAWENPYTTIYLVIEEINRGNCAQIFGDLFQLLDRKEGFSQYPIHADEDIRKCLVSEHTDEDPSFGTNGLDFTPEQVALINQVLDCEHNVAEKIASGEVLVLPPNLYIWATMNTSDQSLFPIDSAFKRRWDWKYIPIEYDKENWVFEVGGKRYKWGEFLSKINPEIYTITESPDKQMGYYFPKANPTTGIISQDTFVNKVLFYLWTDVFKDYDVASVIFKNKKKNRSFLFTDFFEDDEALGNFIENMELVSEDGPVSGDAESI
jgi:hypothetical protein